MNHNHNNHHSRSSGADNSAVYTCPMHPEVVSDKPGLCSECGMALLPQRNNQQPTSNNQQKGRHTGHTTHFDKHAGHSVNIFKVKFWVSFALTIPVMLYSELPEKLFGIIFPAFPLSNYLPAVLGSFIFFYGGSVFLVGAYHEIRARLPGMMTLIALAIITAYTYSVSMVAFGKTETLFWELSSLVAIMLLGHWIEMRAVSGAQGALRALATLLPDTAEVVRGGANIVIPLSALVVGDKTLIKPGGKIPADGTVVEGVSEVNESLLTGESKPVLKQEGDSVIAGAINGDGSLVVSVTGVGEETFLSGIKRLVAEAQASKSRLQMLADRAAFLLTIVAIVAGGTTVGAWLFLGAGLVFTISRLVAVLVVACPHALGLAIPLVASISTTKGAQAGILVKQRLALEAARTIDIVLFDKTGTLTKGTYGVHNIIPLEQSEEKTLQLAASVNYYSEHPLGAALVAEAKRRALPPLAASKFERLPGTGAQAVIDGVLVKVGSHRLLSDIGFTLPLALKDTLVALAKEGKTVIFVVAEHAVVGAITLADMIRPESKGAIEKLQTLGVKVAMITGDSEEVGKWVARELSLDTYFAKVLPSEKADKVKLLQKKGLRVAMVGDGVNDAPALTQADVGIAIGAGTTVAIESAGIILVRNNPEDVVKIIRLSRLTHRKMIQNLWWAAGYNIVAIPLAAGVLASAGIFLEPAVAAILMSVSTVVVAFNALLLRRAVL